MRTDWRRIAVLLAVLGAAGCGNSESLIHVGGPSASPPMVSEGATRASPVVVGRPARVFVFAGIGLRCEPTSVPELVVAVAPSKGEIAFKPGQQTRIATSAKGTCGGRNAVGTGVYYNARAGSEGLDRFAVTARLASGETVTRDFEVRIEP